MKITPIELENTNPLFRMTTKPTRKVYYLDNCWNEITEGAYKDYRFKIFRNYTEGEYHSTLIVLNKLKTWIKSKLKYDLNGERKVLWSYAKNVKND